MASHWPPGMEPEPHPTIENAFIMKVHVWLPDEVEGIVGHSARTWVGLLRDDHSTVLKYPHWLHTPDALDALHEEVCRFERLEPHPNLIVCKGRHRYGVLYEYYSGGPLYDLIYEYPQRSDWQMAQIAIQIADCLVHLHRQRFIHCDLTLVNVFLTAAGDVKIGDIQGQFNFPDGTPEIPTMAGEHVTYRHPTAHPDEFSERTDLFAFGVLLYHLWHGEQPFRELDEPGHWSEIRTRYRNHDFPLLTCAPSIARIIEKCWKSEYQYSHEMLQDLRCFVNGLPASEGEEPLRPRRAQAGPYFDPFVQTLLQQQKETEAAAATRAHSSDAASRPVMTA